MITRPATTVNTSLFDMFFKLSCTCVHVSEKSLNSSKNPFVNNDNAKQKIVEVIKS